MSAGCSRLDARHRLVLAPGADGRADGRHLERRNEPAWQRLDTQLHAGRCLLPQRSIAVLERADLAEGLPVPSRADAVALCNAWESESARHWTARTSSFLTPTTGLARRRRSTPRCRKSGFFGGLGQRSSSSSFRGGACPTMRSCDGYMSSCVSRQMPAPSSR